MLNFTPMKGRLYILLLSFLPGLACVSNEAHKAVRAQVDSLETELRLEIQLSQQRQAYIDRYYDDRVAPLLQRRQQSRITTSGRIATVGRPLAIEPGTLPGQSGSGSSLLVQHLYTDSLHEYLLPQVVLFEVGQDSFSDAGRDSLARLAVFLAQVPHHTFIVEGHTDNVESPAKGGDSWDLSFARAQAVARFLVAQGISPWVIQVSARGKFAPRASNANAIDKAVNRRVDIYLTPLSRYP